LQDVIWVIFPGRSVFLPEEVSIPSQAGQYFCPEEISIPSQGDQHSFPRRSASLPERVSIFFRRSRAGDFYSVRAKKVTICGVFVVVIMPVPVGDTTEFSDAFPRRSVLLPQKISISDERDYSPKCVEVVEAFSEVHMQDAA
jgi:hypothetical protein